MKKYKDKIFITGLAGFFFALMGSIADVFSGFTFNNVPNLNSTTDLLNFENLRELVIGKGYFEILVGDYLAMFFIPASIIGVFHFKKLFQKSKIKNYVSQIIIPIMGYDYILGAILHSKSTSTYVIGYLSNSDAPNSNEEVLYNQFLENSFTPFGWVLVVSMTVILIILSIAIFQGKTPYPKKMVWFSPFVLQIILAIILLLSNGWLSNYFAMASWNLSIALFFLISTIWYRKNLINN